MGRIDAESETLIPIGGSFDVAEVAGTVGQHSSSGLSYGSNPIADSLIPIDMRQASRGGKLTNNRAHGSGGAPGHGVGNAGDPAFTVSERGQAIAFSAKDHGADAGELSPTLRAGGFTSSHANGGCMPAVAFADVADPVAANQARTYTREGSGNFRLSNVAMTPMQVRCLTPRECERLQGFPDDYTLITYRGKPAADGPRYKALGNSKAVPVVRWIGRRIQIVDAIPMEQSA